MISGVSMRSDTVARQLNPQDGLYTVTEKAGTDTRRTLIGAVREVLNAASEPAEIVARIAAPDCAIVSFTVTEKGYCWMPGGKLDRVAASNGFYPILTEAMRVRRDAGLPGLTLLSCDNLAGNGKVLARLVSEWLEAEAPDIVDWFARECTSPCTMVDRIVPASTPADFAELARATGIEDCGAVFAEPFSQWVIEDAFVGPRPFWERHGVQIVPDVTPFETAKLHMLNGAHSLLAYCGLRAGHSYVHQAIGDPRLRQLAKQLMGEEAALTIVAGQGQDLASYAETLVRRFENPAMNHALAQIAVDGSQKVPQRWLETLAINQRKGRHCPAILTGIAAWIEHLRGANGPVDDPAAETLAPLAWSDDPLGTIFGEGGVLASDWLPQAQDSNFITTRLGR
jgi:fructuronate reductase